MILQDNGLVFYEDRSSVLFKNYSLNRINLLTGESQWDRYLKQYVSNITNNEQAVFVAYDLHKTPRYGGNKTLRRPGAILVAAFDIDTGDTLWSLAYEGFGWISRMDANENEIGISGHNGSGLFPGSIKIDVDTGKVLAGEFEGLDETRKIRCQSGDLPLHHHLKDLADCKVVVADDNAVYVLDLLTNSPVWQVDIARAVSNFAVSNDVIYFLAQDGILWALDEKTGTILGHVQFEPVYPDKMELLDNVDFPKYTVVADGKAVALHFKETQQLFFFHFSRG